MLQDKTNIVAAAKKVIHEDNTRKYEICIQKALAELREAGFMKSSGGRPAVSLRRVALQYGISKTTLTERYNGRATRTEVHEKQRKLNTPQEKVLVVWIKELGYRGIPLTSELVREKASVISGNEIGTKWVSRFCVRHPELKSRWSSGLEQSRAYSLNRTNVMEFYDLLDGIVSQYKIKQSNIYNMDEKGVQLGVGGRTRVLVDRNQRTAHLVENGNRELVTIIETVCADGSAIPPSIIFKGVRRNLEWGRDNPINASISTSPNGWTDQELGLKWMEKDFIPYVSKRREKKDYTLLIMDNHVSHVTYRVCALAEKHNIVIICLPSHCTHRLQPCDVGVFGPLASSWKKEVNKLSRQHKAITKFDFLTHYSTARYRTMKEGIIESAFRKSGIWPINREVIEDSAYAPALNTTTKSAIPSAAEVPMIASVVTDPADSESVSVTINQATNSVPQLQITLPPSPTMHTDKTTLLKQNRELRIMLRAAEYQMNADYAQKRLMDDMNAELRKQLFTRDTQRNKQTGKSRIGARHMTGTEMLDELARLDWQAKIDAVHLEARERFKEIQHDITRIEREQKDAEKEAVRKEREQERETARLEREAARELEKERKRVEREQAKQDRDAEKARLRSEKERQKALAKQKREEDKENRKRQATGKAVGGRKKANASQADAHPADLPAHNDPNPTTAPRKPKARPRQVIIESDLNISSRDIAGEIEVVKDAADNDAQSNLIDNDDEWISEHRTRARVRAARNLRRLPRN